MLACERMSRNVARTSNCRIEIHPNSIGLSLARIIFPGKLTAIKCPGIPSGDAGFPTNTATGDTYSCLRTIHRTTGGSISHCRRLRKKEKKKRTPNSGVLGRVASHRVYRKVFCRKSIRSCGLPALPGKAQRGLEDRPAPRCSRREEVRDACSVPGPASRTACRAAPVFLRISVPASNANATSRSAPAPTRTIDRIPRDRFG